MEYKKAIRDNEVRCFGIIAKKENKKYGQECGRLLLKRNSEGYVAGEIKCPICGSLYDIKLDKIILISIGDKK